MNTIHPTAIISPEARLAKDVRVGPYCVIEGNVEIGEGSVLHAHVNISACGRTVIGKHCTIYPFASLGTPPQDLKYHGEKSDLLIGDHCTIREHVTMNPGTEGGGMVTRVGNHCLFMTAAHVAHDCQVGNHVILANNATLAGHVTVGDYTILGGLSAVHQFVRIGRQAVIGGMSAVVADVIPYGSVTGERAALAGLNLVGLKRRGFSRDSIHALRNAYKQLFDAPEGTLETRAATVAKTFANVPEVQELLGFIQDAGKRSLCVPKAVWQDADAA